MTAPRLLALDIGGSKIESAVLSSGKVRKGRLSLGSDAVFQADLSALTTFVVEMLDGPPDKVAVAFPGLLRAGRIVKWPNRSGWNGKDLIAILGDIFPGASIEIEEDANLGAIATSDLFADGDDLIYINAGTGIGCGIVIGGQLVRGRRSLAGELGHTVIVPDADERCSCGKYGCLQLYASGRAIDDRLAALARSHRPEQETADRIRAVEDAARMLALAVSNLVCLLDITHIHLGGGLAADAEYVTAFTDALRAYETAFLDRELSVMCGALRNPSLVGAMLMAARPYELPVEYRDALDEFLQQERRDVANIG